MKLITYASPSHREMCERFVLANCNKAGFDDCVLYETPQVCESGNYNEPGFAEVCQGKLVCLSSIEIGESVCYVDADCLILPGLAGWCSEWLENNPATIGHGKDIRRRSDNAGQFCAGTMVFTQTEKTVSWFKFLKMLAWMLDKHDQDALTATLLMAQRYPVSLEFLDNKVFSNWSTSGELSQIVWMGEELIVPESTLCWHANFVVGVEKKIEMLEKVVDILSVTG
jgi:hypothetical protein